MDYQELKLLEDDLWDAADQLRANSKLTASEYAMPVLGLIFLRHATTRFNTLLPEVEAAVPARATGALREERIKLGFQGKAAIYLPETARYDHLATLPQGTSVGEANRVAAHKSNGLIIDYNGMLKSLRKALATYGQGDKALPMDPLLDPDQALAEYAASIAKVAAHLASMRYDLNALVEAEEGEEKWGQLLHAQNAVSKSPEAKKTFQVLAEDVSDRFRGLFPNPGVFQYEPQENAIAALYNLLQKPKPKVDISAIMQEIRGVIDTSIDVLSPGKAKQPSKQYDLSGIDFERLRTEFAKSPYKETAVLTLQERIQARLELMMVMNPTRVDFYLRYQEVITDFNRDKDDAEIQRVFENLMKVHDSLDQEQQRYVREGFSSERELALYDLLSKDKAEVTKGDLDKVKKAAQALMATVEKRRQEMGDLRDRASVQAKMKSAIIDRLLEDLPEKYSQDEIQARGEVIYQYVEQQLQSTSHH